MILFFMEGFKEIKKIGKMEWVHLITNLSVNIFNKGKYN